MVVVVGRTQTLDRDIGRRVFEHPSQILVLEPAASCGRQ